MELFVLESSLLRISIARLGDRVNFLLHQRTTESALRSVKPRNDLEGAVLELVRVGASVEDVELLAGGDPGDHDRTMKAGHEHFALPSPWRTTSGLL